MLNLILEDCLVGMKKMPAESVDLVVTSPPYNLGINYASYDDTGDRDQFLTWCGDWAAEVHRLLKADGSFFLNIGAAPSNPLLPHQLLLALTSKASGFILQNTIHWVKSITIETRKGESISAGHFKPIQSKRYINDCHEYLFHLTKSGAVTLDRRAAGVEYVYKSNIKRWKHTEGNDKRCRGNNWFIPYDTINSRDKDRPHPATFPVGLVENCLRLHGTHEETHLLDPFLGIGTSALAAQNFGLTQFTGFEIDPGYFAGAQERLAQAAADKTQELF